MDSNARLLIISNNVLSENKNNGKTLLSYIDSIPKNNVRQLYFHSDKPTIDGYNYFQITDRDVFNGLFNKSKRGRVISFCDSDTESINQSSPTVVKKNSFTRLLREILWHNHWKSKGLIDWLDEFQPTAVFFVAGDSLFAYEITDYIVNRYNSKLSLYVTDDYIMPRKKENVFSQLRRKLIFKKLKYVVSRSSVFFTVSDLMQKAYRDVFGKNSSVIVNMTESLQRKEYWQENETIKIIYTGSLYYGRDEVIKKFASELCEINKQNTKKAEINIYTNTRPTQDKIEALEASGCCFYKGTLNKEQLIVELNRSDILLFVESFDKEQIEKTKFSLSTKVPEYLSVGKPIIAIGPSGIGSIEYLRDVSLCINDINHIKDLVIGILSDDSIKLDLSKRALYKYTVYHNKEVNQAQFLQKVL